MFDPRTRDRDHLSGRFATLWQSVFRFGLPFIILYLGTDYLAFRLTTAHSGLAYPWRSVLVPDIALMFIVSGLWWGLMRQLALRKRKNGRR